MKWHQGRGGQACPGLAGCTWTPGRRAAWETPGPVGALATLAAVQADGGGLGPGSRGVEWE